MDGLDRTRVNWRNIKQRLGLSGIGCCGATGSPTITTIIQHDGIPAESARRAAEAVTSPLLGGQRQAKPMMNLAMALAAERSAREAAPPAEANAKTLMRLIEETDGVDWKMGKKRKEGVGGGGGVMGTDWVCCVCIDRCKGAAFIPCGHAFCRLCSRELSTNRGSCPVCNRSIVQILDIF